MEKVSPNMTLRDRCSVPYCPPARRLREISSRSRSAVYTTRIYFYFSKISRKLLARVVHEYISVKEWASTALARKWLLDSREFSKEMSFYGSGSKVVA